MKNNKAAGIYVGVLTVLLFCLCTIVTVNAAVVAEGICGKQFSSGNIIWTLDENGVLTITPDDTVDLDRRIGHVEKCTWDKTLVKEVVLKTGVTAIEKNIFRNHTNLRKVTLPEGFEWIGGSAFYNCTNLTEIAAPDNFLLTMYGAAIDDDNIFGVFESCHSLKSIPDLGGVIYSRSFFDCKNLNHVVIAEGVTGIEDYAFNGCRSLSDLTLPSTLRSLGFKAFSECGLESVAIPDSVTEIPAYEFSFNKNLKTVVIPDSVTRIDAAAFKDCALTEVKLSKNVSSIGGTDYGHTNDFAFDKNVVIDAPAGSYAAQWAKEKGFSLKGEKKNADDGKSSDTKSDNKTRKTVKTAAGTFAISAGQAVFTAPANKKASSLSIPSKVKGVKVTSIAPNACAKMGKLKKVTIPSGVKTIGKKAFYGCTKLKEITIKTKQLQTVGAKAFGSINKKAVIKCPKSKKASYKKLLLKKGLKKTVTFKS